MSLMGIPVSSQALDKKREEMRAACHAEVEEIIKEAQKRISDTAMVSLADLPAEILIEIFSNFRLWDRKNARLVCKRWLQLISSAPFVKKQVTVVDYSNMDNYLSPNIHWVPNVRINVRQYDIQPSGHEFFIRYGPYIESVQLIYSRVWQYALSDILKYCGNLRRLRIWQRGCWWDSSCMGEGECQALLLCVPEPSGLPCDSNCSVIDLPDITIERFEAFSLECPHILKSVLNHVPMLRSLCIEAYNDKEGVVINFLGKQGCQLSELVLDEVHFHKSFYPQIVPTLSTKITKLSIMPCSLVKNCDFKIPPNLINLRHVSLSSTLYKFISERNIGSFLSGFPMLTSVSLDYFYFTDNLAAALGSLGNLKLLSLAYIKDLTPLGLQLIVGTMPNLKLQYLQLCAIENITDECIVAVTPNLPNLQALRIRCCKNLTNLSLDAIVKYCQRLKSLVFCGVIANTERTFFGLKQLKHLGLTDMSLGGGGIQPLDFISLVLGLISCKNIETLFVEYANLNVSEDPKNLQPIFAAYSSLRHIGFSYLSPCGSPYLPKFMFVATINRFLKFEKLLFPNSHYSWYKPPVLIKEKIILSDCWRSFESANYNAEDW